MFDMASRNIAHSPPVPGYHAAHHGGTHQHRSVFCCTMIAGGGGRSRQHCWRHDGDVTVPGIHESSIPSASGVGLPGGGGGVSTEADLLREDAK